MSFVDGADHAARCVGLPVFEQDGIGHWSAECTARTYEPQGDFRVRVPCGWEVTGCESRAEAGARFYGGQWVDR